jgi:hypothetical protein
MKVFRTEAMGSGGGEPRRQAFETLWTLLCEIMGLQDLTPSSTTRRAKPAQTHEPEAPVEEREWIAPAPAQPHRRVSIERSIRLADGSYREVVSPSAQRAVQSRWPCTRAGPVRSFPPIAEEPERVPFDTPYALVYSSDNLARRFIPSANPTTKMS